MASHGLGNLGRGFSFVVFKQMTKPLLAYWKFFYSTTLYCSSHLFIHSSFFPAVKVFVFQNLFLSKYYS